MTAPAEHITEQTRPFSDAEVADLNRWVTVAHPMDADPFAPFDRYDTEVALGGAA